MDTLPLELISEIVDHLPATQHHNIFLDRSFFDIRAICSNFRKVASRLAVLEIAKICQLPPVEIEESRALVLWRGLNLAEEIVFHSGYTARFTEEEDESCQNAARSSVSLKYGSPKMAQIFIDRFIGIDCPSFDEGSLRHLSGMAETDPERVIDLYRRRKLALLPA